ncbi:hydroxyacid dehydrogenase [Streptomyces sp. PT12]|uniref:hydroxyacid dehydrogenase n=1 Tax=Streptomyces sp. PT12 TaxID=1510197 RepID=UPI00215BD174|nr:hydroxyacid dehydrogenase [Streptomyces sp. PT12]
MDPRVAARLINAPLRERLRTIADVQPAHVVSDFTGVELAHTEVLFTSWGCPPVTAEVLARAPRLRAIVHAAGTVKELVTDACWRRGIAVSSAAAANAEPVAEYTLAAILFSGKRVMDIARAYRHFPAADDWAARFPGLGNYRRTVGVVGASRIGRRVIELLRPFTLDVLVSDPYLDEELPGARRVDLDELLASSDIVTLHAPALPETHHMIDAARLASMPDGATLINTARAALVDQEALIAELASGRLYAVLDLTQPEVLPASSPLHDLPNVLVTPHIAGSLGGELARMADLALDELARHAHGLPFIHPVDPTTLARSA